MHRIAKVFLCAALMAATYPQGAADAAPIPSLDKIAVVEVQRCITETAEGIRAKKSLESRFKKNQAKLDRKTKALQQKVQDLQAKAAMLSQGELQKRQAELIQSEQELQQLYAQLQEELQTKEALLTEKIYKKVSGIVKKIAKEEGLQIVLVRSEMTVLYANPKLDLTNRVIVAFDRAHK
ncbi:MAG TPA: OmpH family outer membrane protein [Nannocystis exedens]|nr:OmpH family outer membrane protein [Nannocystis exedens]